MDRPIQKYTLVSLLLLLPVVLVTAWSLWSLLWAFPAQGMAAGNGDVSAQAVLGQAQPPVQEPAPSPPPRRAAAQGSDRMVLGAGVVSLPSRGTTFLTEFADRHAIPDIPGRTTDHPAIVVAATPLPQASPPTPTSMPATLAPSPSPTPRPSPTLVSPSPTATVPASPTQTAQQVAQQDEDEDQDDDQDDDQNDDSDDDKDGDEDRDHDNSGRGSQNSGKGRGNSGKGGGHD